MAKKKKVSQPNVHLALVIDESGSMNTRRVGVVEGVNKFTAELQAVDGDPTFVTLRTFDSAPGKDPVRTIRDNVPLADFAGLGPDEYTPWGGTPLNDAIADTLTLIGKRVKGDDRVLIVIVTDGHENASELSTENLRTVVSEHEDKGWEFIYLGANVDSFEESSARGMKQAYSANFSGTSVSTENAFRTSGKMASTLRSAGGQQLYAAAKTANIGAIAEDDEGYATAAAAIDSAVANADKEE